MVKKKGFNYTYSSSRQEEIDKIREKYIGEAPVMGDKLTALRRLDKNAERPGKIAAFILAAVGTLIFGLGLSMVLVWDLVLYGAIVGLVGCIVLSSAYPTCIVVIRKRRRAVAPQILELTKELSQME